MSKLKDYLLSQTHPVGKTKAKVFHALGFNEGNVEVLEQSLLMIACQDVKSVVSSIYGKKYVIESPLHGLNERTIQIQTIWIIETDQNNPRFVTAYPV
jgi:hypothetical protein